MLITTYFPSFLGSGTSAYISLKIRHLRFLGPYSAARTFAVTVLAPTADVNEVCVGGYNCTPSPILTLLRGSLQLICMIYCSLEAHTPENFIVGSFFFPRVCCDGFRRCSSWRARRAISREAYSPRARGAGRGGVAKECLTGLDLSKMPIRGMSHPGDSNNEYSDWAKLYKSRHPARAALGFSMPSDVPFQQHQLARYEKLKGAKLVSFYLAYSLEPIGLLSPRNVT
jgi:hypothetical protein